MSIGGKNPYKRAKTLHLAGRNNSTDRAAAVNSVRHRLLVFDSLIALYDEEMADRSQGRLVVRDSVVVLAAGQGSSDLRPD